MPNRIAVIGVGNEFRSDDRAGLEVARRLTELTDQGIDLIPFQGDGASLLETIRKYEQVLIIDAVRSNETPGTIHRFDAVTQTIPTGYFNYSTHAFSVAESIEMLRRLNELPEVLHVFGIEGQEFGFGTEISLPVSQAIDDLVTEIDALLRG